MQFYQSVISWGCGILVVMFPSFFSEKDFGVVYLVSEISLKGIGRVSVKECEGVLKKLFHFSMVIIFYSITSVFSLLDFVMVLLLLPNCSLIYFTTFFSNFAVLVWYFLHFCYLTLWRRNFFLILAHPVCKM
jgi:hypothetical protein